MNSNDFSSLSISEDLKAVIRELGFESLTPIQAQSIPLLMEGKDLIGQSKTGSGKTAAFSIPILEKIYLEPRDVQALILCPTRELCTQVAREIRRLGRRMPGLQVLVLSGGLPGRPQAIALRGGVHIAVGTPGRVLDHIERGQLDLSYVKTVVLDEADRMLDMGFEDEMAAIMEAVPQVRQTIFFSATFPDTIQSMSREYQHNPVHVKIEEAPQEKPAIKQMVYDAEDDEKVETLLRVLQEHQPDSAIVFCNQKVTVSELSGKLEARGVENSAFHGDMEQFDRDKAMALFRNGSKRILVATDVAARGIDIENLQLVVNFDLPHLPEVYVHRIGRTGRAGKTGLAVNVVNARERMRLYQFEQEIGIKVEQGRLEMRPPRAVKLEAGMQTLAISGGRKEKVRPGDILGALTGDAGGLDAASVGKIEIHDHYAYVAISRDVAQTALERLRNGKIKGRKFMIKLMD